MEASTAANFTGAIISSVTRSGTLGGLSFNVNDLAGNTTYYVRVGSLWNGTTNYSSTLSTATLASQVISPQFAGTSSFTSRSRALARNPAIFRSHRNFFTRKADDINEKGA